MRPPAGASASAAAEGCGEKGAPALNEKHKAGARQADILWQNTDGSLAIWLMNGGTNIGGGQIY